MTTDIGPHVPHPGSRLDSVANAIQQTNPMTDDYAEVLPEESYYVRVMERAAIFGGYTSWIFTGTETSAYRVLPRDDSRARAYVTCSGTGPVYISSSKDALLALRSGGLTTSGQVMGVFILPTGVTIPVTHQESVFVIADGTHSAIVSVAADRWATTPVT